VGQAVGRRVLNKLTDTQVRKANVPGYYGDGGGLWLQVGPTGRKSWIFRFMLNGKAREMGLGAYPDVPLAGSATDMLVAGELRKVLVPGARDKAAHARRLIADGVDPIEAKRAGRAENVAATAKVRTFDECTKDYITAHRSEWKNAKHAAQWETTLATYASPFIGKLPVSEIDTALVLKVLEPVWAEKTETAKRLRGRVETILASATVAGYRTGDNPARWRNHLDLLLADPDKIAKKEHHAALPYNDIGSFLAKLREQPGTSPKAVELIILTAVRTNEAFLAKWDEFDLSHHVWTIPGERMKSKREHRVPLSKEATSLLRSLKQLTGGEGHVFPGAKEGQPMSNMAGLQLLKRMRRQDITVHGFRSTFRDWAAEQTNFPREVAEAALAHVLKDKTEAAYQRGDLFQKRAKLMQAWADYCGRITTPASVTPIGRRKPKAA
jgi:integrase